MPTLLNSFLGWWRGGAGSMAASVGQQNSLPSTALVDGTKNVGPDGALQIAAYWSCVERRAKAVAALPFFVYKELADGRRELARLDRLYALLHDSPNARMTPYEFWIAMMMNHDMRGNAYARIDRDDDGEPFALWPMPADQVTQLVLPDTTQVFIYRLADGTTAVIHEDNCLHLKNLGNGTIGLSKLEFMRSTTDEAAKAQQSASQLFGAGGKPSGVLMIDKVLTPEQRTAVRANFAELAVGGNTGRLFVLESNMKYQQLSLDPEDQQLLETRQFTVEEFGRWFDIPPILIHQSGVTAWGSGIETIIDGWYKLSLRPILVSIEQAVRKRVMTSKQRAGLTAEFSLDALLRGNSKDRFEVYAKAVQNGLKTRNEVRQLENDPPVAGGDELTAQVNLAPLSMLGKMPAPTKSSSRGNDHVDQ